MATGGGYNITPETENFSRFCLIVVDIFRDMMWELLKKEIKPDDLPEEVRKNKGLLKLTDEQYGKICKLGGGTPDKTDCDVSALYTILRNICGGLRKRIPRPRGGWGNDYYPPKANKKLGDDLERIRLLRNCQYGHATEGKIPDSKYEHYIDEAEEIAERFDKKWLSSLATDFGKQVDDVETRILDEKTRNDYITEVQRLRKFDEETRQIVKNLDALYKTLQKTVNDLEQRTKNLEGEFQKEKTRKEVNPTLKNMLERTKNFLDEKAKKEHFVETRVFKKARTTLQNKNMVFLSGNPGEGKTTLATFLLIQLQQIDKCLIIKSPDDFNHINTNDVPENVSLILIDDMFGVQHFDKVKQQAWKARYSEMLELKKKKLKFVFTNREFIVKQFRSNLNDQTEKGGDEKAAEEKEFFKSTDFELLSSEKLGKAEKMAILEGHLKQANRVGVLSEKELVTCVSSFKPHFAFPLCCRMFAFNENLLKKGMQFFLKPFEALETIMEEFLKEEKLRPNFIALASVWLQGKSSRLIHSSSLSHLRRFLLFDDTSSLSLSKFDVTQFRSIAERCSLYIGENVLLEELFCHLEEVFLSCYKLKHSDEEDDKLYTFSHELIHDAFGRVLFKRAPELVLEKCDTAFLVDNTTTKTHSKEDKMKIPVPFKMYETLAKLLTASLLKRSSDFIALQHDAFMDNDFLSIWFKYVSEERLMGKLLRQDDNDDYFSLFHSSSTLITEAIDQDRPKEELVRRVLFENVTFTEMPEEWQTKQKTKCLELACKAKLKNLVEELLQVGVQLSEVSLYLSVSSGDIDLVKRHIMQKEWSKEQIDTCLNLAAEKGHLPEVKYFIDLGANVEYRKKPGETALYLAVQNKKEDVAVYLIGHGADFNVMPGNKAQNKCIHLACQFGMFEATGALLMKGVDIDDNDNLKKTAPLHFALMFGKEKVAMNLISNGADVNLKGGRLDRTPLHLAAEEGLLEATRQIIIKGGNVDYIDKKGHTAMHYAAMEGHTNIIDELSKWGRRHTSLRAFCHMKKSEIKGFAPIHYAARRGHAKAVQALLNIPGINPEVKDSYGRTPLYLAARFGHHEAVKSLLEKANPNEREKKLGFTALHIATDRGHAKVVEVLCENERVSCSLPDKDGYTPLHIAVKRGDKLITRYLLEHNADTRVRDKEGNVPLHLSMSSKVIDLLCEKDRTAVHLKNNKYLSPFEQATRARGAVHIRGYAPVWEAVLEALEKYKDEPMETDPPNT